MVYLPDRDREKAEELRVSARAFEHFQLQDGLRYAVWTIVTQSHVTNSSVLLIVVSVLILLIGLVSEQLTVLLYSASQQHPGNRQSHQ